MLPGHMIATLNGQISGLTVSSDYSSCLCNLVRANTIALELSKDLYSGWFLCHDSSFFVLYSLCGIDTYHCVLISSDVFLPFFIYQLCIVSIIPLVVHNYLVFFLLL